MWTLKLKQTLQIIPLQNQPILLVAHFNQADRGRFKNDYRRRFTVVKKYLPAITINADRTEARGSISFIASYDKDAGLTWLLEENLKAPGEILNGTYEVLIIKSDDLNELPSLQINLDEGK